MTGFPNKQSNPAAAIPVYIGVQPFDFAPTTPFPATIASGATYDTGLIVGGGALSLYASLDQPSVFEITRYADAAGLAPMTVSTQANADTGPNALNVNDGMPFRSFRATIKNTGASVATVTHAGILGG